MDRRRFLTTTTAVGATLFAGCGGSSGDGATDGGSTTDGEASGGDSDGGATASTGAFRLLISDQPAAIDDFDSLDVTFDSARVFRATADEDDEEAEASSDDTDGETETSTPSTETDTETETETETTETDESETATEDEDGDVAAESDDGEDDDSEAGFQTFDLDSPTVDLTEVVGDKAIGVLDGELETGRYVKIELSVSDVEGIVDDEAVPVKVPSNKLQITKSFEVTAEGAVEFVFDINVVKRGSNGYNLLPVISESGVAGRDVEVDEVESSDASAQSSSSTETATDDDSSTTTETTTEAETDDEGNPNNENSGSGGPGQSSA